MPQRTVEAGFFEMREIRIDNIFTVSIAPKAMSRENNKRFRNSKIASFSHGLTFQKPGKDLALAMV